MAQFIRPDGNVTQTSFTNGFAEIDETTANDADFAFGANNTAAVLEVSLSDPSGTPGSGTCTVRYRIAKTNAGTLDGGGNAVTVTGAVYEGAAQIATDSARNANGTWAEYSFTFAASAVTDWTDVRLRFTTSASGGAAAARRGGAVSWAELETPDAPITTPVTAAPIRTLGRALCLGLLLVHSAAPIRAGSPRLLSAAVTQSGGTQSMTAAPVRATGARTLSLVPRLTVSALGTQVSDPFAFWTTPENVLLANGSVGSTTIAEASLNHPLVVGGYGFDTRIPLGATIDRVRLEVRHRVTTTASIAILRQHIIPLSVGGVTYDVVDEPTALTVNTSSDLARPGGGDWLRADFLGDDFITMLDPTNGASAVSVTYEWDYIRVLLTFSPSMSNNQQILPAPIRAGAPRVLATGLTLGHQAGPIRATGPRILGAAVAGVGGGTPQSVTGAPVRAAPGRIQGAPVVLGYTTAPIRAGTPRLPGAGVTGIGGGTPQSVTAGPIRDVGRVAAADIVLGYRAGAVRAGAPRLLAVIVDTVVHSSEIRAGAPRVLGANVTFAGAGDQQVTAAPIRATGRLFAVGLTLGYQAGPIRAGASRVLGAGLTGSHQVAAAPVRSGTPRILGATVTGIGGGTPQPITGAPIRGPGRLLAAGLTIGYQAGPIRAAVPRILGAAVTGAGGGGSQPVTAAAIRGLGRLKAASVTGSHAVSAAPIRAGGPRLLGAAVLVPGPQVVTAAPIRGVGRLRGATFAGPSAGLGDWDFDAVGSQRWDGAVTGSQTWAGTIAGSLQWSATITGSSQWAASVAGSQTYAATVQSAVQYAATVSGENHLRASAITGSADGS